MSNDTCVYIIIYVANRITLKTTTLIKQDKFVFPLWSNSQQRLNEGQEDSVLTAVSNKFQLIQGPPGY